MKHLLEKAKEDEADAELHQYASEDDDEASVASRQQDVSAVARLRAETLRQAAFLSQEGEDKAEGGGASSSVSSSAAAGHGASSAVFSAAAASGGSDGGANAAESLEARVIRVMQQHMGRMAVKVRHEFGDSCIIAPQEFLQPKAVRTLRHRPVVEPLFLQDFMAAFKVKQKNEEFRRIQVQEHVVASLSVKKSLAHVVGVSTEDLQSAEREQCILLLTPCPVHLNELKWCLFLFNRQWFTKYARWRLRKINKNS